MNHTTEVDLNLGLGFKTTVIIILALEVALGIFASFTVLLIYWNKRQVRSVATTFIANLAAVDTAICCCCVPFTIARLVDYPHHSVVFCCLHEAFTSALRNASFVTLLFICYDRYNSVTKPFVLRLNIRVTKRALLVLWSLAFLGLVTPFVEWHRVRYSHTVTCILLFSDTGEPLYVRLYYLPSFLLACMVFLPAYLRISKVALSRVHIQAMVARTSILVPVSLVQRGNPAYTRQKEWKIAKMTGAVVSSVCVLWLPYSILTFAMYFLKPSNFIASLEFAFLTLGYFNCVLNPLLYAFTKQKFRAALVATLPCKK